jgi:hypothetical protein
LSVNPRAVPAMKRVFRAVSAERARAAVSAAAEDNRVAWADDTLNEDISSAGLSVEGGGGERFQTLEQGDMGLGLLGAKHPDEHTDSQEAQPQTEQQQLYPERHMSLAGTTNGLFIPIIQWDLCGSIAR